MWTPDLVIYHSPCDDGFGAALMAFRKWGDGPEYLGAGYGDAVPDVTGKNVLIVDFSYKADVLRDMGTKAASIVILDHHISAQKELTEYAIGGLLNINNLGDVMSAYVADGPTPIVIAVFDMNRSGAGMTHDFLFPGDPRPLLVNFLEDRDLWRFSYPDTKAISLYLRSIPFDFKAWSNLLVDLDDSESGAAILSRGQAIEQFFDRKVQEVADQAFIGMFAIWDGNYDVPVVNANWAFSSDVCHVLLERHPGAPFVASFFIRPDGKVQWSLRSSDEREDVSEIAKQFGGGGHRNAAGYTDGSLGQVWNGRIGDKDWSGL